MNKTTWGRSFLGPALLPLALLVGPAVAAPAYATPVVSTPAAPGAATLAAAAGSELVAAGDIGSCSARAGAAATAALVGTTTGMVAALGDANGSDISLAQYQQCYGPTWGQYLSRTRPTPGNRDLETSTPTGYYDYFGAAAGTPGQGYYSYDVGTWHIVVLNSSCARAGGCSTGSPQERWLRADLVAHANTCTLAYWHRPLFTSGAMNPGAGSMRAIFQALYDNHADVVLTAHNEEYERFAPQTPAGAASPAGIREFVVGTGGLGHEGFGTTQPNSEVRNSDTFGVLNLILGAGEYSWQFRPVAGKTFTDSGTGTCHAASPPPTAQTLLAAGDISSCDNTNDTATAALVQNIPGTVAALGDLAYESGSATQFATCYDPTWGAFRSRTMPAAGNHEYMTADAAGYFSYWGAPAGPAGRGYYSYNLGSWHIVVVNSNCAQVGGCDVGSPQETWLRADLAAQPAACTLAYWHHPLFSSGSTHGDAPTMRAIFQDLYDNGAEIVLAGHEHGYERFAPQTAAGTASPNGIREFVVGTGGRSHYPFGPAEPTSEVRNATTYGVLQLTLAASSYSWQFLPVAGQTFTDSGTGTCH